MKARVITAAVLMLVLANGCASSDSNERQVLVDYSNDEFPTFVLSNFPKTVSVTPGQTIVFKQTWTGEPHTVTGGTLVSDALKKGSVWLDMFSGFSKVMGSGGVPDPENAGETKFAEFAQAVLKAKPADSKQFVEAWDKLRTQGVPLPDLHNPPDVPLAAANTQVDQLSESAFDGLIFAMNDNGDVTQNAGQPCFLATGAPPKDEQQACSKAEQRQPEFDGRQSFYNSGILKYEGAAGNTYRMKLADNIAPGTYFFYCAIHGPQQLSEVVVKPRGSKVPSQRQVSQQARKQLDEVITPLTKLHTQAVTKGEITFEGEKVKGPFAGLFDPSIDHAGINEFLPKTLRAKANEPITWRMMGADHTITFDVPSYFPIVDFSTPVKLNPRLRAPAGGAPPLPEQQGEGVLKIDGGTYSGNGFWSSGMLGAVPYVEYTLRIAKPGTYNYACLVHPPMVGKVVVS